MIMIMRLFEKSSQPRSNFIKVNILFLLCFLFIGNQVLSQQISPFSFTPDEFCEFSTICEEICNSYGFPMVSAGQPVPTMFHICVNDLCYCSAQPNDQTNYPWTKGRAISKYNSNRVLLAEEGKQYDYEECLTQCSNDDQVMSPSDDSTDQAADTDLIFIIVVNGDCYCDATPEFTEEFSEVPDENEEGIQGWQEKSDEELEQYNPQNYNVRVDSDGWPIYNPEDFMGSDKEEEDEVIPIEEPEVLGKGKGKVIYDDSPPPPLMVDSRKHMHQDDGDPLTESSTNTKKVKHSSNNSGNTQQVEEDSQSQLQNPQNPVSDNYGNEGSSTADDLP